MLTVEIASQIAQTLYGVNGTLTRLPGEADSNFHLASADGNEYLLKIAGKNSDKSIIEMQNDALHLLHSTSANQFYAPALVPTLTGERIGTYSDTNCDANLTRLFSYLPGKLLGELRYHSPELLESLGTKLGHLSQALHHFRHHAAKRYLKWDLKNAYWIRDHLDEICDSDLRPQIETLLNRFESDIAPLLPQLRQSVIHGDINDYNIVVAKPTPGATQVAGFIDFGDLVLSATICELAITITYAIMNKPDPLAAAAQIIKGYHAVYPLLENELDILFDLIQIRLCISVVVSAIRKQENPHDPYLTISEQPAYALLAKLREIHPRFALYTFRAACGLEPCPQTTIITEWLKTHANKIGFLLHSSERTAEKIILDLSPGSLDGEEFDAILAQKHKAGVSLAIGRYNEARLIYSNDQYQIAGNQGPTARTIHIGLDLFETVGTPVHAPLAGHVHSFVDNNQAQDYGPTIVLEHTIPETNIHFYTLYGHLSRHSLKNLSVGKAMKKGDVLGWLGDANVNGGWTPHLHFQLITDMFAHQGNFPGVADANKLPIWLSICPDPNLITRFTEVESFADKQKLSLREMRDKYISDNVGLSYQKPLQIIRGIGQYLFDENGHKYLDCVNNVCHVGHCHPKVVKAGQQQLALLNTNTRYLHKNLVAYAERLAATLPNPLEVCFFVCSGSEANELALRLAAAHTGRNEILVMDHAYHGNTTSLINISPYKFNGPGGKGKPDFVHLLPMPDPLRDTNAGKIPVIEPTISAFICESLLSCGGQIVLPNGYLRQIYAQVRTLGGVCIADEVQTGLARVGTHYWGFETQGVVPDILTVGKPLGNGYPLAAVVTTRAIADSFANGMEYFNTFGGNPVACAIGLSVLEVIEEENLQAHALKIGDDLKQKLHLLQGKYPSIGDVRGLGLFIGIEFVTDKESLTPAKELTGYVVNRMKERGVLLSIDGPYKNVIKIKPPLVFTLEDSDYLIRHLDDVLSEVI